MLKGFWGKKGVPHTVTVQTFHAQVVGAGLSGLEAETPTEAETELLDKALVKLARRAMGSRASYEHTDGTRRHHSDDHIRRQMGLHCRVSSTEPETEMWREIKENHQHNRQLLHKGSSLPHYWVHSNWKTTWKRTRARSPGSSKCYRT